MEGKDAAGAAVSHKRQAVGGANEAARRERQLGPAIDAAQREADLEAARRNRDPNVVENLPSETREKIEQSEKRALGENARKSLKQAQLDENVARGRAAEAGLGTSAPRQVPLRHGERLERNEDGSRPRVQHTVPDELRPPAAGSNREQAVNIKSTDLGHFNQNPLGAQGYPRRPKRSRGNRGRRRCRPRSWTGAAPTRRRRACKSRSSATSRMSAIATR